MKILHVININGYGGAEKLLLQLLPALQCQDTIECAILNAEATGEAASSIGKRLQEKGIVVHFFSYNKWYAKSILRFLANLINKGDYTLVHSHLKHADTWMARLKWLHIISVPVVSTMHGYNDAYENKFGFTVSRKIYFSPYFLFSKLIYRYLDGFIMISGIIDSFFTKTKLLGNKRKEIIYHGYELTNITNQHPNAGAANGSWNIAVPGRLIRRKGHRYLIEAVGLLNAQGLPVCLHVYGSGEEQPLLEQQVQEAGLQDRVVFYGYVDNLHDAISKMDVVVIPSLWEGFGLVFLDAFSAEVPVVAFDLPAANEIIRHEYNGLLAKPGSANDLSIQIARILQSQQLGDDLVKNASSDLRKRFNIDTMAAKYRNFYKAFADE